MGALFSFPGHILGVSLWRPGSEERDLGREEVAVVAREQHPPQTQLSKAGDGDPKAQRSRLTLDALIRPTRRHKTCGGKRFVDGAMAPFHQGGEDASHGASPAEVDGDVIVDGKPLPSRPHAKVRCRRPRRRLYFQECRIEASTRRSALVGGADLLKEQADAAASVEVGGGNDDVDGIHQGAVRVTAGGEDFAGRLPTSAEGLASFGRLLGDVDGAGEEARLKAGDVVVGAGGGPAAPFEVLEGLVVVDAGVFDGSHEGGDAMDMDVGGGEGVVVEDGEGGVDGVARFGQLTSLNVERGGNGLVDGPVVGEGAGLEAFEGAGEEGPRVVEMPFALLELGEVGEAKSGQPRLPETIEHGNCLLVAAKSFFDVAGVAGEASEAGGVHGQQAGWNVVDGEDGGGVVVKGLGGRHVAPRPRVDPRHNFVKRPERQGNAGDGPEDVAVGSGVLVAPQGPEKALSNEVDGGQLVVVVVADGPVTEGAGRTRRGGTHQEEGVERDERVTGGHQAHQPPGHHQERSLPPHR